EGQHSVQIAIHVRASDAQDPEASIAEPAVVLRVRIEAVLTVIDLDNEPLLEAYKINDATIARRLAAEVNAPLSPGAQVVPQSSFLRAHWFAGDPNGFVNHGDQAAPRNSPPNGGGTARPFAA